MARQKEDQTKVHAGWKDSSVESTRHFKVFLPTGFSSLRFCAALLRFNSCAIKIPPPHLKCTVRWQHIHRGVWPSPPSIVGHFHPWKRSLLQPSLRGPRRCHLPPWATTHLFYISVDLPINGTLQHVVLCDRLPSLSLTFARSGVRFCRKCIFIFLAILLCILDPFPISSLICLSY